MENKMSIAQIAASARRALAIALVAAAPLAIAQQPASPQPATPPPKLTPDAQAVKKLLEQKFPGAQIASVSKSAYFGLYEAQFEDRMVYTDAKVQYVFVGSIYDAGTKTNLTDARLRELNRIAFDTLPLDLAFVRVKGDGSRKLAIFSDADCPFCAQLEKSLRDVDNVTIYTFLYPIDQLHPDAARKSKVIWCSPDRAKAWDAFFSTGALPDNPGDCATPLARTSELGNKLRVTATPTLVFADGSIVPGAMPPDRLESEFRTAEAEAKKLAAKK
jgi:thiol:disulfide interchange protein DsbC